MELTEECCINRVQKYKISGYNGRVERKKGASVQDFEIRKVQDFEMRKMNINNLRKLEETEYEELIRLRVENEYIKVENAVITKRLP